MAVFGPTRRLRPAGHWCPAGLAIALVLSGALRILDAQVILPVHQERRHRLVLARGPIKLLDVQILPGDTTFYHTHDSPILRAFVEPKRRCYVREMRLRRAPVSFRASTQS